MFGNQDELNIPLSVKMIVAVIGSSNLHESIITNCLDIIEGPYAKRIKPITYNTTEQLPIKKNIKDISFGLINIEWNSKTIETRPASVILVYDVRNKSETISWKDFEYSIYADIQRVKKMDNYPYTPIAVFIFTNTQFSFDSVIEERDRPYNIKKSIDPKNLYFMSGSDYLRTHGKKISTQILKNCINYYRVMKKELKIKKTNSGDSKEKLIKYNIKLGIVSLMKNKKPSCKYLEEAYNTLTTLDPKSYYYGTTKTQMNYWELKAVADWLFFKLFFIKSVDEKQTNLTQIFNNHMNNFSKLDLFQLKGPDANLMALIEYYWRGCRFEFWAKHIENKTEEKRFNQFSGYYYMLCIFNQCRLIKFIKENQVFEKINLDKNVKSDLLKLGQSKFYGKPPLFYIQVDPLTTKEVEFEDLTYLKMFLSRNGITIESLIAKTNEYLYTAQRLYHNTYFKDKIQISPMFYVNFLSLMTYSDSNVIERKQLKSFYKIFLSSSSLNKFSRLYLTYLEQYNKIIMEDNESQDQLEMLSNLINISSIRQLTQEEEDLYYQITFANENEIKSKFILNEIKNNLLTFEYSISNNTPRIFDLVNYKFTFTTGLRDHSIKFKTISLVFTNSERNKTFFDEVYEVSPNKKLELSYSIFIKDTDKNLRLKSVRMEVSTENENVIYYEINVSTNKEKIIYIKAYQDNILEFNYPRNIIAGIGQNYSVDFEINKKDPHIDIEHINLHLYVDNDSNDEFINRSVAYPKSGSSKQIMQVPNSIVDSQQTDDFNAYASYSAKPYQMNLFEHEFIVRNPLTGEISTHQNSFRVKINNAEDTYPVKYRFLVRFKDKGNFSLNFDADYKILKREILDDSMTLRETGKIVFEVIAPFTMKHELFSSSYQSAQKTKIYPSVNMIKLNATIYNNLVQDALLCDVNLKTERGVTSSTILDPLNKINKGYLKEILQIQKHTDYNLPINLHFDADYSGSIGQLRILWKDKDLDEFDNNIFNVTELPLPEILVQNFDLSLSCEINRIVFLKQEAKLKIIIQNKSEEFKRLIFLIDSSSNFVISGQIKKKLLIYPKNTSEFDLTVIPLTYGKVKLPPFKVMEFPLKSNSYDHKLYSIYHLPDYVQVERDSNS